MKTTIDKVAKEGEKISKRMGQITKNFRLGCGIYIDKPVRPFHYYYEGCEQQEGVCTTLKKDEKTGHAEFVDILEFQNLMSLRANSSQFRDIMTDVGRTKLAGNQDDPESGLTALMQVMMCKENIGWRDNSNRLIIYSSDSEYHQAGDGKLGGIVRPNDGQCHLDNQGYYTHASILDYPSVSHINYIAKKHNMKIIFAITNSSNYYFYETLSKAIKDSSFVELQVESDSIVDLIETEYKKIISHVDLNDTSSDLIDVKYQASCSEGAQFVDLQRCENLKIGNEVKFKVTFKLKECPANESVRRETFEIKPSNMNESVIVNVQMICECPCETQDVVENADTCNGNGAYQCGVCKCNEDYSGWNCECHDFRQQGNNKTSTCVPTPDQSPTQTALECSGVGVCECGKCSCYEPHISGPFCECDNRACRKKDNKLCNGHGTCECGTCKCDTGWTHESAEYPVCDCNERKDSCLSMNGTVAGQQPLECSGHGTCVCNRCSCRGGFTGQQCQDPPLNLVSCRQLEPCVECLAYNTGPKLDLNKATNCSDDCSSIFELSLTNRSEINRNGGERGMQCNSKDLNGCAYQFVYYYDTMKLRVRSQREKPKCEKIDIMMIILTTTGIGVFVGVLALIAWKLATMTFDRLEYMKFMKEQGKASWDQAGNPLYKAPTTTIQNPMFQTDSLNSN
ncbi:integrin beta-PS isoform X2 [Nilaparvata lugens]|nr:integrin beta-PS isoform X2 [Nilaparvata lugens]